MEYEPVLHVVLHQPEIPQNTGNIGRTCVAVGAKLWLVRPLGFRIDAKQLRRAGLDYWRHLEWEVVEHWDALTERLPGRRWCFSKSAPRSHTHADYARGDVLVFGCETAGLPESILRTHGGSTVRIPMRNAARSLNLSSAAAIGVYEAMRQITGTTDDFNT